MKAFVTGASGFIGSSLVKELVRQGNDVTGLVRSGEKAKIVESAGGHVVLGDVLRRDELFEIIKSTKPEAVFHLAMESVRGRLTKRKMETVRRSKSDGTKNMIDACQGVDLKAFVYGSGVGVVGDHGEEWVDESTTPSPSAFPRLAYEPERYALAAHSEKGLPVVVLRPGWVCGVGSWFELLERDLMRGKGRIVGDGQYYWSIIHQEDVARAFILAAERGSPGETYFAVDDQPVRLREFMDFMAEKMSVPRAKPVPVFLAKLFLGKEFVDFITSSVRAKNTKIKNLGFQLKYPTYREAVPEVLSRLGMGH